MAKRQAMIVEADDARNRFAELLRRVQNGQYVTITKNGVPVARLVPYEKSSLTHDRREAITAMRRLAAKNRLEGLSVKGLIAEGQR